jgi:hypothetical protein
MELAAWIKFSVGRLKSSCRPFSSDILALTCMKSSPLGLDNLFRLHESAAEEVKLHKRQLF